MRRHLARAFPDGTAQAVALFDETVEATGAWLEQGSAEGGPAPPPTGS